jgi:23S rRNA (cytidine1920-2'-O)/16S rRNA (cytidine1409-2'-O)-methyltransferase
VLLVKPQFECGRGQVGSGGVIRDPKVRGDTLERVLQDLSRQGFRVLGVVESPLAGADGNVEFLAHLRT